MEISERSGWNVKG